MAIPRALVNSVKGKYYHNRDSWTNLVRPLHDFKGC